MKKTFDKSRADFEGWASKNDLRCSDGRIIRHGAFRDNDGQVVPLVWMHRHNEPFNVLGSALLEIRDEGVYTYGSFNDTESGRTARGLLEHGDITALSIYANQLRQNGGDVLHGNIREVSLVLAGANPGAYIESVIQHGESSEEEGIIYTGENILSHADTAHEKKKDPDPEEPASSGEKTAPGSVKQEPAGEPEQNGAADNHNNNTKEEEKHMDTEKQKSKAAEDGEGKTIKEVFDTLTEEQKNVVYAMIGIAMQEAGKNNESDDDEEDNNVKHNAFDQNATEENSLSHDEFMAVMSDAKRYGSLKDSFMAHGIEDVDFLFPEARTMDTPPSFVEREMGWVRKVLGSVHRTPFSRIRSVFADLTEDDARARGYIKGNQKLEEVFGMMKRTTTPTTVYKKQKMDRDDVADITDFDAIAWLKSEMRVMLDEELARSFLIGDGRSVASADKISEDHIRPIMKDHDLYTIKTSASFTAGMTDDQKGKAFIRAAVKARKNYKGTGDPTLFTTEDMLINLRLMEDSVGHILYDSDAKLASALRVKEIVTVPVMEGVEGPNGGELLGIIVNLADYNVGADKGGAVSMFDDFDIDVNQQKYLIETRCSGALIKPFSAIVIEANGSATPWYAVTPVGTENPSVQGWYQKFGGAYVPTNDTTVKNNRTYYDCDSTFTAVTPEAGDNPKTSDWYELVNGVYAATNDTTASSGKTYYSKS